MTMKLERVRAAVGSEFDDTLFNMCRTDDYVGIYMEIDSRLSSGWQPIETAPKDGTAVLLYGGDPPAGWTLPEPSGFSISHWRDGGWFEATGELCHRHENPTHWRPLIGPK